MIYELLEANSLMVNLWQKLFKDVKEIHICSSSLLKKLFPNLEKQYKSSVDTITDVNKHYTASHYIKN